MSRILTVLGLLTVAFIVFACASSEYDVNGVAGTDFQPWACSVVCADESTDQTGECTRTVDEAVQTAKAGACEENGGSTFASCTAGDPVNCQVPSPAW